MRVYFVPTVTNTGSIGIKLDGASSIACRTVRGDVLPAGYLRIGVATEAWYDGTNWIVGRAVQYYSGADGEYWLMDDGRADILMVKAIDPTLTSTQLFNYPNSLSLAAVSHHVTVSYSDTSPNDALKMSNIRGVLGYATQVGFRLAVAGTVGGTTEDNQIRFKISSRWY